MRNERPSAKTERGNLTRTLSHPELARDSRLPADVVGRLPPARGAVCYYPACGYMSDRVRWVVLVGRRLSSRDTR